ncbi:uncharacterized transposon-derived protein F54H12.3 [Trichonephila clavata]|uniref:Uncharacterized transposon-derived protein F54H12.3 n=1 Tax=Trichonephila clavata TaxID=2740835 RepID=A0A8X6F0H7_TRICU|nr:uncharacterized transposon-derived protein F54H12.3 [Trichonephila clavata]
MQPPPPQKPFEMHKELLQEIEAEQEISSPAPSKLNMIAKYIAYTIPKTRKKYILPILEKLREVHYMFNDMNELQRNGKIEYRSNGIDLFSYLMRNEKAFSHPSTGFSSQMDPKWKERESSSAITPESTKSKKLTAERLRKLSNDENSPEASETHPKKWTTWKDVRKLSNQESSPESQKTQPVNDDVERLKKLYYDPKEPSSFGGVKRLTEASGLKKSRFKNFLSGEDCYALHFPERYKFQRRKTIAYGVNELWESDLVHLQRLSMYLNYYRCYVEIFKSLSD